MEKEKNKVNGTSNNSTQSQSDSNKTQSTQSLIDKAQPRVEKFTKELPKSETREKKK